MLFSHISPKFEHKWHKWWRHEATFSTLNISKTKRWFIVAKFLWCHSTVYRGKWCKFATWKMMERTAVLWFNWHLILFTYRSWQFAGTLNRSSSTSQWCCLDEVLIAHATTVCRPFTVDYTRLFCTTAVNNCRCMHRRVYRLSICNGWLSSRREQCQFTAKCLAK